MKKALLVTALTLGIVVAAGYVLLHAEQATLPIEAGIGPAPQLPAPNRTLVPTINIAPAVGWTDDAMPVPASGLRVQRYADGLDHPRWLYVLPNGDVLVAESNRPTPDPAPSGAKAWVANKVMTRAGAGNPSADRITLLRDADGDGRAEFRSVLLRGLRSPFGMTLVDGMLYVANADALVRVPYRDGDVEITAPPEKLADLPAGLNHHWTKNVVANADGSKLYVTVGSNSNVGENGMDIEEGRAMIWEYDRASGAMRPYATGLRNPNGLDWEPATGALWTAVNERDEIGSDLVPDYVTSVQDGGFYGWPYSWYGRHVDERVQPQRPDLVAQAIVPDYALGAHTASLGISFATRTQLPAPFADGLFVAQHGSWNRRPKSGYKVIFVPFRDGRPSGQPIDVLTGFLDADENARGRPVDVKADARGALLVTDDVGDVVWRVSRR